MNSGSLIVLSALLAVSFAYVVPDCLILGYSCNNHHGLVASRSVSTEDDVCKFITDFLDKKHASAVELMKAAEEVVNAIDNLLSTAEEAADPTEVRALIKAAIERLGSGSLVSSLFDDVLTSAEGKLSFAFQMWDDFVALAKKFKDNNEPRNVIMAAIRETAEAIKKTVAETSAFINNKIEDSSNPSKRRVFTGFQVSHGSHSGTSYGVSIGFDW